MKKVSVGLVWFFALIIVPSVYGQRGKIIKTGDPIMDFGQDGYVSRTTSGFSSLNYNVPEFDRKMFGIPIVGGDTIGRNCGIDDFIPDTQGYSSYVVRLEDADNNLIFRFRVGDSNNSVESLSILLDTDGLFGMGVDPNATTDNPGFEINITLIKSANKGVYVYNIDGVDKCPTPLLSYPFDSHSQIAVADEQPCGNLTFFFDFYVPFREIANALSIDSNTGLRFVAVTNVSATCALGGKISDVSGINDTDYKGCYSCMFNAVVNAQSPPTPMADLCEICSGFKKVSPPTINQPLVAGQRIVGGTTVESNIFVLIQVFTNLGTATAPRWDTLSPPRMEKGVFSKRSIWNDTLPEPLLAYDKVRATAKNKVIGGGNGNGNQAATSVTTNPEPSPVAQNQNVVVNEDTPLEIFLGPPDPVNFILGYSIVTNPTHGTLGSVNAITHRVTYVPSFGYFGPDHFTFKITNGTTYQSTGTIDITVNHVNHAPIANSQGGIITPEDTPKNITLTATDIDTGDVLRYIIVRHPAHGTVSLTGNAVTYTPAANYFGQDSFTFKANDGTVDSNIAIIFITVTPVNDAPVAINQSISVVEDTPTGIRLSATDVGGNTLAFTVLSSPAHGTLSGTAPNLTYIPALNYNGPDSFTFKANDGIVDSNTGTISITVTPVNDAPVANNQSVTTDEDVAKVITLSGSDVDGNSLTYSIVAGPAHGTVSLTGNTVTYIPTANFFRNDGFTFKANDGTVDSNIATVSITVTPVNDAPIAINQSISVIEDTPTEITLSALDVGNALTFAVLSSPAHGTLSGTAPNLTYIPALNYNGPDSFTFKANDGIVDSNTGTISITVTPVNDAPVANNQSVTTDEDVAKVITLSGSDVDGNSLTYSIVAGPAHGTVSLTGNTVTYTPAANFFSNDGFTFKANDGTVDSNIATVSITVTPVNDAPIANDQSLSVVEDTPTEITLSAIDAGDALTFAVLSSPAHGTLSGTAPNLTYIPALNYNGPDSFTFKANDGIVDSNTGTISITVTPVNDAPVANNQSVTTDEDVARVITLSGSDVDGNSLTYSIVAGPAHGTVSLTGNTVTYTPAANFFSNDGFTFKANDGTVDSNIATVSITVTPVNDAPIANDQSLSVVEDTPTEITLSAIDAGDALTFTVLSSPAHGTLSGTAPNLTYIPALNYNGPDSFTFKANDGIVDSNTGTISITVTPVNDAPVANNQSVTTDEDVARVITLSGSDVDGNTLTYSIGVSPAHGTLSGTAPNLTYTSVPNYNGPDNFTFTVDDGTGSANSTSTSATVSITVTPVNDAPVADNQTLTTPGDTQLGITLTGSDVDENGLTYTIGTPPQHGSLSGTPPNLIYTPAIEYNGPDNFTFTVDDGAGSANSTSNVASVSITVTQVNDPPIADNQSVTFTASTPQGITLTGSDPDGDPITFMIVSQPTNGTLTGSAPNVTYTANDLTVTDDKFTFQVSDGTLLSNIATVILNLPSAINYPPTADDAFVDATEDEPIQIVLNASDSNGDPLAFTVTSPTNGTLVGTAPNLTYVPALNYNGTDIFTFTVDDGTSSSTVATVTINVTPVNDTPIANDQSVTTSEDIAKSITLTGSDVDGNTLAYTIATGPAHGTLSGSAPNLLYTPAANYNGPDNFTFTVNDGTGNSNSISAEATVSITITPVNDAPVADDQTLTSPEDTDLGITLTGSDVDENSLTYNVVIFPTHGVLNGTAPNLTYVPTLNYNGPDSFTFTVDDGTGSTNSTSSPATVTIGVTPVNDAPIANRQTLSTAEDTDLGITLTGSDVDGDILTTYTVKTTPVRGTLSGTAPNLIYTPDANYFGPDAFTFTVEDGLGSISAEAVVFITITPVNDPPVANNQILSTPEDTDLGITLTGSGVDGNGLTYNVVTSPVHGVLIGTAPNLTYVPTLNYNGLDSFVFTVDDGTGSSNSTSNPATVSIEVTPVNDTPIADRQVLSTAEDTSLGITLKGSDVDGNTTLTYTVATAPARGTLSGTAPNLTYTPDANYFGPDAFTFTIDDGTGNSNSISAEATVFITITPVNDSPVADDQTVSTPEDTDLGIALTGNDVDGNGLTYSVVTSTVHGVLIGTAPNLTYVPTLNYNGPDSFTFTVNDGRGNPNSTSAAATVSITVTAMNDTPIADDQVLSTAEDTPLGIILTGSDVDGNTLTYTVATAPARGILSGTALNLTYTPSSNYFGPDVFTFTVDDGTGSVNSKSTTATVSITITPVNDPPVANGQPGVTLAENSTTSIALTGNDVDDDALTYIVVNQPLQGTLGGSAPNLIYTPGLYYHGNDSFTFKVNDGLVDSNIAAVDIVVTPVNQAPIANDQSVMIPENGTASATLAASDVDNNALTFTIVVQPQNGTLSGTVPNLTYTPTLYFNGSDHFIFKANDGTVDSNVATFSITVTPVNQAPVAFNQTNVTAVEDSAVPITLVASDVDGNALTYIIVTPPTNGTLSGTGPNVTYTPALTYNGPDGFTFKVNDGVVDSNIASISITVLPLNNAPIANDQSVTTQQDVPKAITLTSSDIDGDPHAYSIIVDPLHGSLTGAAPNLIYTPGPLYNGSDSFTFKANDGIVDSNIATVAITITPVNHPPVISFIPDLNMKEDTVRLVCLNVIDVDGDQIIFGQPSNTKGGGTMTKAGAPYDFCYTFSPSLNYNGESIWDLNVCDTGGLCDSRSVKIIITPVNDPPYAVNDEVEVNSRQTSSFNVMANDYVIVPPYQEFYDIFSNDPAYRDALTMTTTPLSGPFNGTVQMIADGTISYTPKFDFAGSDSIRYQICDRGNLCASAVAFIKVEYPPFKIYEGVSPNGDNTNDYWRIDGIELYPNNLVRVFDRFNNVVFETSGYSNEKNNWQGQANHGLAHGALSEGTYFYTVDLGNGDHALSGYVELKRQ